MERPIGFVVHARMKLPIGFRFHPTDEELVAHYLRRKAFGLPLPSLFIHEFEVFNTHPLSYPGDVGEKDRYFFSRKQKNGNGNCRRKRPAGSGYWKHTGKDKQIIASNRSNQTVGRRRTLVYHEATKSIHSLTNTRWFMHEYCLTDPAATGISEDKGEEWAVYHVFRRKRKTCKNFRTTKISINQAADMSIMPDYIDFTAQDGKESSDFVPPPPDSP